MKRKLALLLVCLLTGIGLVIAQTPRKVTGIVTSEEDNEPVVGASVLVKGTTVGTTTDIDGKFTINNVPSSARTYQYKPILFYIIIISFLTLPLTLQENADFTLY